MSSILVLVHGRNGNWRDARVTTREKEGTHIRLAVVEGWWEGVDKVKRENKKGR